MEKKEPAILWFEDMEKMTRGIKGISLVWANEIHIDAKYKGTPQGEDLIKHELKHHEILWKPRDEKPLKRSLRGIYNNIWDWLDLKRLHAKWRNKHEN